MESQNRFAKDEFGLYIHAPNYPVIRGTVEAANEAI